MTPSRSRRIAGSRRHFELPGERQTERLDHLPEEVASTPPRRGRRPWIIGVASAVGGAILTWSVTAIMPSVWESGQRAVGKGELAISVLTTDSFDAFEPPIYMWPPGTTRVPVVVGAERAHTLGAVDSGSTSLRLSIKSNFDERVTLQKWEVEVERAPSQPGIVVLPSEGGNVIVRHLAVDLDSAEVRWLVDEEESIKPPPLFVHKDEEETIDVVATTETSCVCRWRLRVTYTVAGGEAKTKTIEGPGHAPFVTATDEKAALLSEDGCEPPLRSARELCRGVILVQDLQR